MATKTFAVSKDAVVVRSPSGTSMGAGREDHLSVGNTNDYKMRSFLQFSLNWTSVYAITSATLKIKATSTPTAHGTKTTHNFYIDRVTGTWDEGDQGSDELWHTDNNGIEWSNQPGATDTGRKEVDWSGVHNAWESYDITAIVRAWAPSSQVAGGGDATNYGIRLMMKDETVGYVEFYDRSAGTSDAYIELVYSDTLPQTNPSVVINNPPNAGLARISNMSVVQQGIAPDTEFKFTYTDPESQTMSKYRVKVFRDAGKTDLAYDSGDVAGSWATGTQITYQMPQASAVVGPTWRPSGSTSYWVEVTVWDSYSTPGSGTATNQFKIVWGDFVVSRQVGETATSIAVAITPSSTQANTQRQVLYRLSSVTYGDQGTHSAWVTSVGALPQPSATYTWLHIYVRFSSDLAGTTPSVDKIDVTYQASGGQPSPDKWTTAKARGTVTLDIDIRRYGSKSLKLDSVSAGGYSGTLYEGYVVTEPVTGTGSNKVKVTPNTDYVFTCEVRHPGLLKNGRVIYLSVDDGSKYVEEVDPATGNNVMALASNDFDSSLVGTVDDLTLLDLDASDNMSNVWTPGGTVDALSVEYGNGGIPYDYNGRFYVARFNGAGWGRVYSPYFAVTPGQTYTHSMRVRANAEQVIAYLYFFDAAGTYLTGSATVVGATSGGGWQSISGSAAAPAGAASAFLSIEETAPAGYSWIAIDQVKIKHSADPVNLYPDGWKRLRLAFKTGPGVTEIRPLIVYRDIDGTPTTYWLDGAMLTEGTVAPSWAQGTVAAAGTIAASGVQLDGASGAIFRMRGSDGGVRSTVSLGTTGLVLGGDTQIWSPQTNEIKASAQFLSERGSSAIGTFLSRITGDTNYRQAILSDGAIQWGDGSNSSDGNLYRAAANILKTYDSLSVGGHALSEYYATPSATTCTVANTAYAVGSTPAEISFTPAYVGQRWLITAQINHFYWGASGACTATFRITDGSNGTIVDNANVVRHEDGSGIYRSGGGSIIWAADAVATRKVKLYVSHTTAGAVVTWAAVRIQAIPLG